MLRPRALPRLAGGTIHPSQRWQCITNIILAFSPSSAADSQPDIRGAQVLDDFEVFCNCVMQH